MRGEVGIGAVLVACHAHAPVCQLVTVEAHRVQVQAEGPVQVHVGDADQPMFGVATSDRDQHVFRPAFPFTPGLRYTARTATCALPFALPEPAPRRAEVIGVRPARAALPENTLRFYVSFSVPMAEGAGLRHVRLEDLDAGEDVSGVFFDPPQELWSRDRTRLTLLFDPGRVKTGLAAHEARGRALQAGVHYRLHILASWPTLDGRTLSAPLQHDFHVTDAAMTAIDVAAWQASTPDADSHVPLDLVFDRPVDHVSVGRYLAIVDPGGRPVVGQWHLTDSATRARFTPRDAWPSAVADLTLRIDRRFEDVAGNTVDAAFDHAIGAVQEGSPPWHRLWLRDLAPLEASR